MQHHPASATTAKFCVQQIEQHGGKVVSIITLHVNVGLGADILGRRKSMGESGTNQS